MDTIEQAHAAIANQLKELNELIHRSSPATGEASLEALKRWKARTAGVLRRLVHPTEAERFSRKRKSSFRIGDAVGNLVDEARIYAGFLDALDEELRDHPDVVLKPALPPPDPLPAKQVSEIPNTPVVFVVHGHDELNLLRLKEVLRERWRLEPLVLSGQPGRGRALIEKFEEEAQRAAFAFALITPDDFIQTPTGDYAQARPNVLFELGWFYGRLGRERVCIIYKKGTSIHSDLDGVSRIEFVETLTEKLHEIERELLTARLLEHQ
jgi:predicted nucleotide-binding protein